MFFHLFELHNLAALNEFENLRFHRDKMLCVQAEAEISIGELTDKLGSDLTITLNVRLPGQPEQRVWFSQLQLDSLLKENPPDLSFRRRTLVSAFHLVNRETARIEKARQDAWNNNRAVKAAKWLFTPPS
jgi:hypothetical protein